VTVVDTVAPTVTCLSDQPQGGAFIAKAVDACTASPLFRFGSYTLANPEKIKINEGGQSGIALINTLDGIRHFHAGKGEAIISATDGSGNVGKASCQR
jgi:hypothetical protein